MGFQGFLLQTRATLSRYLTEVTPPASRLRKLYLVMGNESCDLDSAVSALTLAFVYAQRHQQDDYVPILNIPRIDYPLKTEVGHMFGKCGISQPMLLFRDDLPKQLAKDFQIILVDHHVSPLNEQVKEIYDHRPVDKAKPLPEDCVSQIEPEIGSCATLVGERYLAEDEPRSSQVNELLHATIVLDTINFSPTAKRFAARDLAMVEKLEELMDFNKKQREALFEELVNARADISQLSLKEVLSKDMKTVEGAQQTVPLAGMPILVKDFVAKEGAKEAVCEFANGRQLIILMGMYVSPVDKQVQRDVGLISLNVANQPLMERLRQALVQSQTPDFQLRPHEVEPKFMGGHFLRQHNIQATRKQILPLVKRVLDEWETEMARNNSSCECDEVYFFKEKPKMGLS